MTRRTQWNQLAWGLGFLVIALPMRLRFHPEFDFLAYSALAAGAVTVGYLGWCNLSVQRELEPLVRAQPLHFFVSPRDGLFFSGPAGCFIESKRAFLILSGATWKTSVAYLEDRHALLFQTQAVMPWGARGNEYQTMNRFRISLPSSVSPDEGVAIARSIDQSAAEMNEHA